MPASIVSAPTLRASTTMRPVVLIEPPVTSSPGETSTGVDSPVTRLASTALDPSRTVPSVATFSPGPHDELVADDELVDGDAQLARDPRLRVDAQDGHVLGAEVEQRAQGVLAGVLGARLEEAADEQERRDDRGDLEVEVHAALEQLDDGVAPRGEHADRDERVHRRGEVAGVDGGGAVEGPGAPEDDGRREEQLEPRARRRTSGSTMASSSTGIVRAMATTSRGLRTSCAGVWSRWFSPAPPWSAWPRGPRGSRGVVTRGAGVTEPWACGAGRTSDFTAPAVVAAVAAVAAADAADASRTFCRASSWARSFSRRAPAAGFAASSPAVATGALSGDTAYAVCVVVAAGRAGREPSMTVAP